RNYGRGLDRKLTPAGRCDSGIVKSYCRTVPDSVKSRGNAAAAAGPPLKTKAQKRAEAKAAKARARAMQKRRQALTVGGAAVVVLALVVGLIVWIGHSSS